MQPLSVRRARTKQWNIKLLASLAPLVISASKAPLSTMLHSYALLAINALMEHNMQSSIHAALESINPTKVRVSALNAILANTAPGKISLLYQEVALEDIIAILE